MTNFVLSLPNLRSRSEQAQGKRSPQFQISIDDVSADEAPIAMVVYYGQREHGDGVALRRHGGRLFAEFDGKDYWANGPRARTVGASPAIVRNLAAGNPSAFLNIVSPGKSQYRNRRGPIIGDDRPEIAAKVAAFIFIDGRLHRAVEEPVWHATLAGYGGAFVACPKMEVNARISNHPSSTARFDRPEVADALCRQLHGRHRDCRFLEPLGSVDVIDPSYEPSYDVMVAMAEAYGDDILRKLEPELPNLDRGCADAFATMAKGFAALANDGHVAAVEFCDGFHKLCERLTADKRRVPSDLTNWVKGRTFALKHRIEIARIHESETPALPQP
jgi:hypothetical protein